MADPYKAFRDINMGSIIRRLDLNLTEDENLQFQADFLESDRITAKALKKALEHIAHLESKLSQPETSVRSSQRHTVDNEVNGQDYGFHLAMVLDAIENAQDISMDDKAELRLKVEALQKGCHDLYQECLALQNKNKADDCLHVGAGLSSDANPASDDETPSDNDSYDMPGYDSDSAHSEYIEEDNEDSDDDLSSDSTEDSQDIQDIIGGDSLDKNLQYSKRTRVRSNLFILDGATATKVPTNAQASLNKATKTAPSNNKRPSAHIVSDTDEEDGLPVRRGVRAKVQASKAVRKPSKKQKTSAFGYDREAYQTEPGTESSPDEEDGLPIRRGVELRALRGVKSRPNGQKSDHIRVSGKKEKKVAFANDPKLSQPQPAAVGHANVLENTNAHYGYGEASNEKTYHRADANGAAGSVADTPTAKYNEPGNYKISTMSELMPGANPDIVAMRKAVMSANIAADVRDSCIHQLDTLATLMADENDQLISGLMDVTAMIEAYSGSNDSLTTTIQEDPVDAHYRLDVGAEQERSQSDLYSGIPGAVEGHSTVAINSNTKSIPEIHEDGLDSLVAFQETQGAEKQLKEKGTDNLNSGSMSHSFEMETKLKAEFLKHNICEHFAQGKCCSLQHSSKALVARLLNSSEIPKVWKQEYDTLLRSKDICGDNARDRCCRKAHRSREEIYKLLSKVDERLGDYYTVSSIDNSLSARHNSKLAKSQGFASAGNPDDSLDSHVDDNVPVSVKESVDPQTAEALEYLGICEGYYHKECCGRVHLSLNEAQSKVPGKGPDVMARKRRLIQDHNACWQHISHQIPRSKASICCKLRHPDPIVMSEKIRDYLEKKSRKCAVQQENVRREAGRALRMANTPKLPGLTPFHPTHR